MATASFIAPGMFSHLTGMMFLSTPPKGLLLYSTCLRCAGQVNMYHILTGIMKFFIALPTSWFILLFMEKNIIYDCVEHIMLSALDSALEICGVPPYLGTAIKNQTLYELQHYLYGGPPDEPE